MSVQRISVGGVRVLILGILISTFSPVSIYLFSIPLIDCTNREADGFDSVWLKVMIETLTKTTQDQKRNSTLFCQNCHLTVHSIPTRQGSMSRRVIINWKLPYHLL